MDVSVPNGRSFFLDVLSAIQQEQLIKRSPRGQAVGTLIEAIKKLPPTLTDSITCRITSELYQCLDAGKRHKLPSMAQSAVWSAFHTLHLRKTSCVNGPHPSQQIYLQFATNDTAGSARQDAEAHHGKAGHGCYCSGSCQGSVPTDVL